MKFIEEISPEVYRIKRLQNLLSRSLDNDADLIVSAILSEIRKILEDNKGESCKKYKYLSLFCDWVLHNKLDLPKNDARENIIKKVHNILLRHNSIQRMIKPIEVELFYNLRRDLRIFLKNHNLSRNLVRTNARWKMFLDGLILVISFSPLIINEGNKKKLKKIHVFKYIKGDKQTLTVKAMTLIIRPPHVHKAKGGKKYLNPAEANWIIDYNEPIDLGKEKFYLPTSIPLIYYSLGRDNAGSELNKGVLNFWSDFKIDE